MLGSKLLFVGLLFVLTFSEVYFHEKFEDGWTQRWVNSKREGLGAFVETSGEHGNGIKTSQDAKFYSLSAQMPKSFSNDKKDLVVQFLVKFEQGIDCGGGYIKVHPKIDQEKYDGNTAYNMMFGPDICGSTKKVHLIFNYKGKNLDWKKSLTCESDKLSHIYTVVVKSDSSYEVLIDGVKKESGFLLEDWDFLPPKTISDPTEKKPEEWIDVTEILDPNDKKPLDWEKPKTVADPSAKKPEDWSEEEDGKWEPAQIPNSEYRGEWTGKMIPNPEYKGAWKASQIPNPDFTEDDTVYKYSEFATIGLDLWQVKSGTIFDDIFIGDNVSEAEKIRETLLERIKAEKQEFDQKEEEQRKKDDAQRKKDQEEREKSEPAQSNPQDELEKLAKERASTVETKENKDEL